MGAITVNNFIELSSDRNLLFKEKCKCAAAKLSYYNSALLAIMNHLPLMEGVWDQLLIEREKESINRLLNISG